MLIFPGRYYIWYPISEGRTPALKTPEMLTVKTYQIYSFHYFKSKQIALYLLQLQINIILQKVYQWNGGNIPG